MVHEPRTREAVFRARPPLHQLSDSPAFLHKVGSDRYASRLAALPPGSRLSLYLHIPFCTSLCWYCGCFTKAVRRYEPVGDYL